MILRAAILSSLIIVVHFVVTTMVKLGITIVMNIIAIAKVVVVVVRRVSLRRSLELSML